MSKCNCVCSPVCCCPVDSVECKQALKLVEEKFTSTNKQSTPLQPAGDVCSPVYINDGSGGLKKLHD